MKKKNHIIGILCLTICFISTFSIFANAATLVYPTSFQMRCGYHIGGSLSDVWTAYEGDTMDFRQNMVSLEVMFDFPNTRSASLYFYFTDTSAWAVVEVKIRYVEWFVPVQHIAFLSDGNHELALYSAWTVNCIYILFSIIVWYQTLSIDYLALKSM